jgi:hypothetical protein
MSSALTNKSAPPIAGYIPPALSDRMMDSIPDSSRMPLAIWASAVDRNVETEISSEDFIAAPSITVPNTLKQSVSSLPGPIAADSIIGLFDRIMLLASIMRNGPILISKGAGRRIGAD